MKLCLILLIAASYGIESLANVATPIPTLDDPELTRRILNGTTVTSGWEFMVYLKLPHNSILYREFKSRHWLCAGTIIHRKYIITSAACIEEADRFYVVSGTYGFNDDDDRKNNECIRNGAKRAVWKCVPKNYEFNGKHKVDLRWLYNDFAIVKIDGEFNFHKKVEGCDFIPRMIKFNNNSYALETPSTTMYLAGWGSNSSYTDGLYRRKTPNQKKLQSTRVEIEEKDECKRIWGSAYDKIIEEYMICSKDTGDGMSAICDERYVDCEDIDYSYESYDRRSYNGRNARRQESAATTAAAAATTHAPAGDTTKPRQGFALAYDDDGDGGGFCENDHGGPLISMASGQETVVGVISVSLIRADNRKCFGPFLYTSVYKNKQLIECAIYKERQDCKRSFRTGQTHEETDITWKPAPGINADDWDAIMNSKQYENRAKEKIAPTLNGDKLYSGFGFVMRDHKAYFSKNRTLVTRETGIPIQFP